MTVERIVFCVYMLGVVLAMRVFVERDPEKRSQHDVEISAVMAIGWPIVLVLAFSMITYLVANQLPPFDDVGRRHKKRCARQKKDVCQPGRKK